MEIHSEQKVQFPLGGPGEQWHKLLLMKITMEKEDQKLTGWRRMDQMWEKMEEAAEGREVLTWWWHWHTEPVYVLHSSVQCRSVPSLSPLPGRPPPTAGHWSLETNTDEGYNFSYRCSVLTKLKNTGTSKYLHWKVSYYSCLRCLGAVESACPSLTRQLVSYIGTHVLQQSACWWMLEQKLKLPACTSSSNFQNRQQNNHTQFTHRISGCMGVEGLEFLSQPSSFILHTAIYLTFCVWCNSVNTRPWLSNVQSHFNVLLLLICVFLSICFYVYKNT